MDIYAIDHRCPGHTADNASENTEGDPERAFSVPI